MIGSCELKPLRGASVRYLGVLAGTVIAACAAVLAGGPLVAAAGTPASSGSWSRPRVLSAPPGVAGAGYFTALSCASASAFTAVGTAEVALTPSTDKMVAGTERRGAWGRAVAIAAPIAGPGVSFGAFPVLSCASAGNCAAGDGYSAGRRQGAFVVSQTNGTWGKARKVPSGAAAISCPAAGDCTAALGGGDLLNERRGTWRTAFPVPGLAALSDGQPVGFTQISCTAPGNCSAAGIIGDPAGDRAFVVTEKHRIWGNAQQVRSPLLTGLEIAALSCSSAGDCAAGGLAFPRAGGGSEAFAVTQAHGTWGTARPLPGIATRNGEITELACPAAGACSALGNVVVNRGSKLFVATEKNGTWRNPQTITGAGNGFGINGDTLGCPAVGSCVLAGATQSSGQAATAMQVNGRWGPARVLPGILATDHDTPSALEAVSCPARSRCTAVGSFGILVAGRLFATTQR